MPGCMSHREVSGLWQRVGGSRTLESIRYARMVMMIAPRKMAAVRDCLATYAPGKISIVGLAVVQG
jgi:hypothetical protein